MSFTRICTECSIETSRPRRGLCPRCYFGNINAARRAATAAAKSDRIPAPPIDRLLDKVAAGPNGCWIWTASLKSQGYGQFVVDGKNHSAHRISYELHVGPIPEGLHLDHLCHNQDITCPGGACLHRRCINPGHLEPVTNWENQRRSRLTVVGANLRKTHCPQGHPYSGENLIVVGDGSRRCRQCASITWIKGYHRSYLEQRRERRAAAQALQVPCGLPSGRGGICARPQGHGGRHCRRPDSLNHPERKAS